MTRLPFALVSAAGAAVLPAAALAQSETSASAEIGVSSGYSSNPFAGVGGGAAFAELRVRPMVQLRTAQDTFTLVGDAQIQQYSRLYSTRDNYNARLNYTGRTSERLTLTGNAGYVNALSGSSFGGAVLPDDTGSELPEPGTDLGLFGTGNRRQTVNGQVGASYAVTALDQVNTYFNAISTTNSRAGRAVDYHGAGAGLGYSRRLSETTSAGLRGSVDATRYTRSGRTLVYSVAATLDMRLSDRWSINGSLGASRLDSSATAVIPGEDGNRTVVSGDASLCYLMATGQVCLGASRAVLPSSFGGARVQSAIDASYRTKLSERASLTARSSYTDVDGSGAGTFARFRYWSSTVGFTHRLTERLDLSATGLYRTVDGGTTPRADDVGGTIGISYTVGKAR